MHTEKVLFNVPQVPLRFVDTGFGSVQHFNRCFKSRYGCTPSAYKKTISRSV